MTRKVILISIAFILAVVLFAGYMRLTGNRTILPDPGAMVQDIPDKPVSMLPRQVGQTIVHSAMQSRYLVYDPVTKKLKRAFGFEALLNQTAQSPNWQVRKPYMNLYEDRFQCRLDADEGTIQVEVSGNEVLPKDARLMGKVIIRLLPTQTDRFSETVIFLDDLNYSSERSEFFTEGPVELISSQVRLVGKGMSMIYNPQNGRIDYFEIRKLDYLRLKNAAKTQFADDPSSSTTKEVETIAASQSPAADKPTVQQAVNEGDQATPAADKPQPEQLYYKCTLQDNVLIRYGRQFTVSGADRIDITHILWGSVIEQEPEHAPAAQPAEQNAVEPAAAVSSQEEKLPDWSNRDTLPNIPADDDQKDILVTCKGKIVLLPMKVESSSYGLTLNVELTGSSVHVVRHQETQSWPVVQCQTIHYNPDGERLKLFTGPDTKKLHLAMEKAGSFLETEGSVLWDRQKNYAVVEGPGRMVYQPSTLNTSSREPAEVRFGRKMEVYFVESKTPTDGTMALASAILTGGMDAVFQKDGLLKTSAQTGKFEFGQNNQLTQAELTENVKFSSESGTNKSQAGADKVLLRFLDNNTPTLADLKGNVRFESGNNVFVADDAKVQFIRDEKGRLLPVSLTNESRFVFVSQASESLRTPARFEGQKINYTMSKKLAVADGPVAFNFAVAADPNDRSSSVPVTITAQKSAEFYQGDNNSVRQVVFNGDVVGDSTVQASPEKFVRRFYGQKLTADFTEPVNGKQQIGHVAVSDGNVRLQGIRYINEQKILHVELTCKNIDYHNDGQTILAAGPGKIELNNQQLSDGRTVTQPSATDLRQPCYALIEGFNTMQWYMQREKIEVRSDKKSIALSYLTMKNNQPDKLTKATTSKADLQFAKDDTGRNILKELLAWDGVVLEQQDEHILVGQTLKYDGTTDWVQIQGSPNNPCFVDGARVPAIEYNLKTGNLKTQLSTSPGAYAVPTK